ncbi:MAG: hypothetical protein ACAI25_20040 [Planctomycetota bacterium]
MGYLTSEPMPDGTCLKCGWKAPAGLLKCPFCKTYIREPGSGSSGEEKAPPPRPASPDPALPAADPTVVRHVQRELARELFDDSDKWPVFEGGEPPAPKPEDDTDAPG